MDQNLQKIYEEKISTLIRNLDRNNMKGTYLKTKEELLSYLDMTVTDGSKVSVGGSQTLFELDLIDYIRNRNVEFFDRYEEGLTAEGKKEVFRRSFSADYYFTSSNAVTLDGYLYNVDHFGNRVAALLYGPDKVFVIVGINKIVTSLDDAISRVKSTAAPANNVRLNRDTPCVRKGDCMDCQSSDRICSEYTLIKRQGVKDRIEVIILPFSLGY